MGRGVAVGVCCCWLRADFNEELDEEVLEIEFPLVAAAADAVADNAEPFVDAKARTNVDIANISCKIANKVFVQMFGFNAMPGERGMIPTGLPWHPVLPP